MQQLDIYLRAASVKAVLVDQFNNTISTKASITRGMQAEFILHLFHSDEEESLFTAEDLAAFTSWAWYADSDYDLTTTPKLQVLTGIYVDADGCIHIPVDETNTAELITYLSTSESKDLKCELVGLSSGETKPGFILQWDFSVRNRIGGEGTGQPTPVGDSSYTRSQVDALFAASNMVEYSSDGESWTSDYISGATQRRYKNSAISGAEWTVEALVAGPDGSDGKNGITYHLYVGYAADSAGADFSISAAESRKYRAEFHSTDYIETPALSHFTSAGATWLKYLGDDGSSGAAGSGDMSTSDYVSSGGSGVVISASHAASADAVSWSGITGKPSAYTPADHHHIAAEITDGARQTVFAGSSAAELYLNRQIIQRTGLISNGILNFDFTGIKVSSGGSLYAGSAGDVFTWEYWVFATTDIINISVGSALTISALEDEPLPEDLPVKGGNSTLHAFAVRAFYKSGAVQNLKLTVNYLYSTEA